MNDNEIKIFVSYSHKNSSWVDKADEFNLIPFIEQSLKWLGVSIWYDNDLKTLPGVEYEEKIKNEIDTANIAILLLSRDFINSDFIINNELPWIKKRNSENKLEIVPILVEPWTLPSGHPASWLVKTQIIPGDPTPLIEFTDSKRNFLKARNNILNSLERTIERIKYKGSFKNSPPKAEEIQSDTPETNKNASVKPGSFDNEIATEQKIIQPRRKLPFGNIRNKQLFSGHIRNSKGISKEDDEEIKGKIILKDGIEMHFDKIVTYKHLLEGCHIDLTEAADFDYSKAPRIKIKYRYIKEIHFNEILTGTKYHYLLKSKTKDQILNCTWIKTKVILLNNETFNFLYNANPDVSPHFSGFSSKVVFITKAGLQREIPIEYIKSIVLENPTFKIPVQGKPIKGQFKYYNGQTNHFNGIGTSHHSSGDIIYLIDPSAKNEHLYAQKIKLSVSDMKSILIGDDTLSKNKIDKDGKEWSCKWREVSVSLKNNNTETFLLKALPIENQQLNLCGISTQELIFYYSGIERTVDLNLIREITFDD